MRALWLLVGGSLGLVVGAVCGFGVALVAMTFHPRYDGTYGMREMLVCLPSGTVIGLVAGLVWAFRTRLAGS